MRLTTLLPAGLLAALALAPAAQAVTQTQSIPGLGTVTVNEASIFDGGTIDITITPAAGTVDDPAFSPIVLIDTGRSPSVPPEIPDRSRLTLRATAGQVTVYGSMWGQQDCQWISGPGGHAPLGPVTSRRAADGSSLTFVLSRVVFLTSLPVSFRWIALDANAITPADTCDPAVGQSQPGNVGVKRDIVTGSFAFTGVAKLAPEVPTPPAPPEGTPAPAPDADGIRNDWLIAGKPAPAPRRAGLATVTATTATLTLPKAAKGTKLRVYRRTGDGAYALVTTTTRRSVRVRGLKPSTRYEFRVVAVKAGKQSAESKPLAVKTRRAARS